MDKNRQWKIGDIFEYPDKTLGVVGITNSLSEINNADNPIDRKNGFAPKFLEHCSVLEEIIKSRPEITNPLKNF